MATKIKTSRNYRKQITKSVGIIHDELINISDELVEGSIATGVKWQKLWSKAIKNSEPLVSKQMDIMYNTLKGIKGQVKIGGERVKSLINDEVVVAKKVVAKRKPARKVVGKKRTIKRTAKKTIKKTDNLKAIEGIGPKLESILNANGIKTYNDLAKAKVSTLKTIIEKAGPRYKMHNPSTWSKQAKTLK